VINWVGLQHAGTRAGLATPARGGFAQPRSNSCMTPCSRPAMRWTASPTPWWKMRRLQGALRSAKLLCVHGASGDQCLSEAQVAAIRTLHAPYKFPFALANGFSEYPGWGVSGEATKSYGPTGGWSAWWLGAEPPALPPLPTNGIAWVYGAGGIQHIFARDPNFDVRKYRPEDFAERVREVSR